MAHPRGTPTAHPANPPLSDRLDPTRYPFGGALAVGGVRAVGGERAALATLTFEEERREVLESVLQAMAGDQDRERSMACRYLLRHLTRLAPLQAGLLVS